MKTVLKLISGFAAAAMTVCAVPLQPFAAAADQPQEIEKIELFGINETLCAGYTPAYTAHLSEESAAQMTLTNEAWVNIETDEGYLRSSGDAIPYPEEGEEPYYAYYVQLVPKEGYVFPEYFKLYYEGWEISMMDYDVTVMPSYIAIRCDFLGAVTPAAEPITLETVEITGAALSFSDGDAPAFSGKPAAGSHFSVLTEGWDGGGERVMSRADLNRAEYLDGRSLLTAFSGGTEYTYFLWIVPDDGYVFRDSAALIINGQAYSCTYHIMQSHIEIRTACRLTVPAAATSPPVTTAVPVSTTAASAAAGTTTAAVSTATAKPVTAAGKVTTTVRTTTTAAVRTTAPEIPGVVFGDVNLDGRISISDAVLLLRFLSEDSVLRIRPDGIAAADADRDGSVTMIDCMLLLRQISAQVQTVKEKSSSSMPFSEPGDLPQLPKRSTAPPVSDGGNSAAFTAEPLPGLTVSAEKNALHYDGQLQFSPLTEDDLELVRTVQEDYGLGMIGGWHVDAGLDADAYLPGVYHSEFDLTALEIPESLYDTIKVVRYDEEGRITFYNAQRAGSVISWDSAQNSVICICTLVGSIIVTLGAHYVLHCAALAYIAGIVMLGSVVWNYDEQAMAPAEVWAKDEVKSLVSYDAGDFCIWYADPDAMDRNLRIRQAEEEAEQQAEQNLKEDLFEDVRSSLDARLRNPKLLAAEKQEILAGNAQYQKDIKVNAEAPDDVLLLAEDLRQAHSYLQEQQGLPKLGFQMNVLYSAAIPTEGYAEKPPVFWRDPYLVVKRRSSVLTLEKEHHSQEITCTHEMYHAYQSRYIDLNDRSLLKFMEMSATMVETDFVEYMEYTSNDLTANTSSLELFSIPIDRDDPHDEKTRKDGYCLSRFFRFLNELDGTTVSGKDLCLEFVKAGQSLTGLMLQHFGIEQEPEILAACWEAFLQHNGDELQKRYAKLYAADADDDYDFQSVIRKVPLTRNPAKQHISVGYEDYTGKGVYYQSECMNFSLLLLPDEGLTESLPMFSLLPLVSQENENVKWLQTAHGTAISVRNKNGVGYAEKNGINGACSSGYTVYYLPQPAEPTVTYVEDEDFGNYYQVVLNTPPSNALKEEITDEFLILLRAGKEELLRMTVDLDNWDQPQIIWPEDIKTPKDASQPITVVLCEYMEAGGGAEAFYGPESAPVLLGAPFPELDLRTTSASGSYGGHFVSNEKEETTFRLDQDGFFAFTFPAENRTWDTFPDDYDPDTFSNPFLDLSRGYSSHTGFTVTGKVQNTPDVNSWTADLSTCAGSFEMSYYEYYRKSFFDEETEGPHGETETKWRGSGMVSGTLELSTDDAAGIRKVTVVILTDEGVVSVQASFKE